jgi:hypothetical protein
MTIANDSLVAWATVALAAMTLLLSAATGILARFTFKLWKATQLLSREARWAAEEQAALTRSALSETRKSADAAVKSAHVAELGLQISERAYMRLSGPTLEYSAPGAPAEFRCTLKNSGRTPGMSVTLTMTFVIGTGPPEIPPGAATIVEGITVHDEVPGGASLAFFTPAQFTRILDGSDVVFFRARIDYRDVFSTPHRRESAGVFRAAGQRNRTFAAFAVPGYDYDT